MLPDAGGVTRLAAIAQDRSRPLKHIQRARIVPLCGVGFTMSLFIGLLAFAQQPDLEAETKVGVLFGLLACLAAGALVLRLAPQSPAHR